MCAPMPHIQDWWIHFSIFYISKWILSLYVFVYCHRYLACDHFCKDIDSEKWWKFQWLPRRSFWTKGWNFGCKRFKKGKNLKKNSFVDANETCKKKRNKRHIFNVNERREQNRQKLVFEKLLNRSFQSEIIKTFDCFYIV